jgi:hypothetical protein
LILEPPVIVRIEAWVWKAFLCCYVASFLSVVGVEGILFVELAGSMLLAEFAKIAGGWLWCNDTTEVGLGCLDRLVGKMRDKDIVGGGIDADAFLVGEGCQWHTTILLALCAPH